MPSVPALSPRKTRQQVNLHEYGVYVADKLSEAWDLAKKNIKKAQKQQKKTYDQHARPPNFTVGERVPLFKPTERTGEKRKLARAYHGLCRVIKLTSNNAHIRRVDRPEDDLLLVAMDRLKRCPDEVCDTFLPPDRPTRNQITETSAEDIQLKRGGNVTLTESIIIIIYCMCMYMHVAMPCACARARRDS